MGDQMFEPVGFRDGVVVEEGDDVARRDGDTAVTRAGESFALDVLDRADPGELPPEPAPGGQGCGR